MEIRILGPLEVVDGNRVVDLGGGKQRALLADLAIHRGETLPADRLIDDLWGDRPPPSAAKTLHVLISRLRKTLGRETIVTRGGSYSLTDDGVVTDVEQVDDLLGRARKAASVGHAADAAKHIASAAALFRAQPLADFTYEEFAQTEIARLDDLRLSVLEERMEHELAAGESAVLIPELEALVREHPLRERLRAQLMLALYRAGRQADALEAYHAARTTLVGELGIEPGRSLRELEQAILQQDPSLDAAGATARASVSPDGAVGFLVGREHELEQLRSGLEEAFQGRGGLFLLVGEPGIGKSRIAEEVLRDARQRGAVALAGRCWEAGGAPAYWPWVQSLRTYIDTTDPSTLRAQLGEGAPEIAQILPELREFAPDAPGPPLDSDGARFRLFDATARFLKSAAAAQPIVLLLDDLHAADEPSMLLLRFLATELGGSRVLVIGTYRDVDPTVREPLTSTLAELARERVTSRIELRGLTETNIRRFIELTTKIAAPAELVEAIHRETEGNPLFVGEVVRLLAAEGSLENLNVESLWTYGIPQGVREVIGRRLGRLSPQCVQVLTLASVLGREFRLDALEALAGETGEGLLDLLDEAVEARVLAPASGTRGTLRFAHALIRETLYDQLTTVRRVQLHRAAGDALEDLYGEHPDAHLAELAYHFFEAAPGGDADKAVAYARRAAERALSSLAYEEAARLARTGLDAVEFVQPHHERARCELLVTLGEAESRAGNMHVAKEVLLQAAELARTHHLPRELARAAAVYGGRIVYARAGDDHRLVPLLEEALAAIGEDEATLRARLLARLAGALRDEHSRLRRDRLSAEAVRLARSSGDAATLAYALDARMSAYIGPDRLEETLAIADELRERAEAMRDYEPLLSARFFRFIIFAIRCEVREAEVELSTAQELARELHQPAQLCQTIASRAMLSLAQGDFEGGRTLAEEAFRYGETASPQIALSARQLHRYALGVASGDVRELVPDLRVLVESFPERPFFRCVLVHVLALLGDEEAERGFAALATDGFSGIPLDTEWLHAMSLLTETSVLLHDVEHTDDLYRLLTPYAEMNAVNVPEGMGGSMLRYLGLLAGSRERWDDAADHFSRALEINERMGLQPWVAATQEDFARMLLRSDREPARAAQLLDAAIGTYSRLGMHPHAERATALRAGSASFHR